MSKIFSLLAVLLILTGIILIAAPHPRTPPLESLPAGGMQAIVQQTREIAEQVQAPLSSLFGLISLYWNRKNFLKQQEK